MNDDEPPRRMLARVQPVSSTVLDAAIDQLETAHKELKSLIEEIRSESGGAQPPDPPGPTDSAPDEDPNR